MQIIFFLETFHKNIHPRERFITVDLIQDRVDQVLS